MPKKKKGEGAGKGDMARLHSNPTSQDQTLGNLIEITINKHDCKIAMHEEVFSRNLSDKKVSKTR